MENERQENMFNGSAHLVTSHLVCAAERKIWHLNPTNMRRSILSEVLMFTLKLSKMVRKLLLYSRVWAVNTYNLSSELNIKLHLPLVIFQCWYTRISLRSERCLIIFRISYEIFTINERIVSCYDQGRWYLEDKNAFHCSNISLLRRVASLRKFVVKSIVNEARQYLFSYTVLSQ